MVTITVNGVRREVQAPIDTPLLYVLRNDLELSGPAVRLRPSPVRSLLRPARRQGNPFLRHAALGRHVGGNHHPRRAPRALGQTERLARGRRRKDPPPRAAGMDRGADAPLRLLPERHDDQSHRTAGEQRDPHRRPNQSRVYDLGSLSASLPLRKLHRNHRGRPTRLYRNGERRQGMNLRKNNARLISATNLVSATNQVPEEDEVNVFGAALSRRNFVKAGGALFVGFGVLAADGVKNIAQAAPTRNIARRHAPRFLDRNSSRQHHPHPHRQKRLRSKHRLHRLPPDRRGRIEHHLRSRHHRGDGRHRSHARRQRSLRFPRQRNAQYPQSRRVYPSSPARPSRAAPRRREVRPLRQGRHRFAAAARACPTAIWSKASS